MPNPGFTSNNGGVVINLSNLNKITLSENKSTARLGAGLTWLDVYVAIPFLCSDSCSLPRFFSDVLPDLCFIFPILIP
jgi:hypothetical protein